MSEPFRDNPVLLRAVRGVIHQMQRRLLKVATIFGLLSIICIAVSTQFDDFRHAWFFSAALVAAGIAIGLVCGVMVAESSRYSTNI